MFKKSKLSLIGLTVLAVSILMIFLSKPIVNDIGFRYFATTNFVSASTLNAFTFGVAMLGYLLVGVGACLFLFIGWTSRFRVDHASVHSQVRKVKALFLVACCVLVAVSMVSTQQVNANSMSTTGYYLATPYSPYDWLIGQYSTGLTYAINGSSWANMMTWPTPAPWASLTDNSTAVTEAALTATTSGVVYLKGVAFDLALMNSIGDNVAVVESVNGLQRTFINPLDSQGSPYTISVSGVNYLSQDSKGRFCYTSTDGSALWSNTIQSMTNGGSVEIVGTIMGNASGFTDCGISNIYVFGTGTLTIPYATDVNVLYINSPGWQVTGITLNGDFQPNPSYAGIRTDPSATGTLVSGTKIVNCNTGIYLQGGGGRVFNNVVSNSTADGITTLANDCVIANNLVNVTWSRNGISLVSSSRTIVQGNNLINSYQHGIALENLGSGTCFNTIIIGNTINGTSQYDGINIYDSSGGVVSAAYCQISNNEIFAPTRYGITITSGIENQITKNTISNTTSTGIYLFSGTTNTDITGNTIYNPGLQVFYNAGATGLKFNENTVHVTTGTNNLFLFAGTTTYCQFKNNQITVDSAKGNNIMYVTAALTYSEISGNILNLGGKNYIQAFWLHHAGIAHLTYSANTVNGMGAGGIILYCDTAGIDYLNVYGCDYSASGATVPIITLGDNTQVHLSYNGTIWIP